MNVLINEFFELYKGNACEETPFEYIDYSVWEKDNQTWSVRPSGGKDVKIDFDTAFSVVKFLLF